MMPFVGFDCALRRSNRTFHWCLHYYSFSTAPSEGRLIPQGAESIENWFFTAVPLKLDRDNVFYLLDDAIDLLSESKLLKLIKDYIDPDKLKPDKEEQSLIDRVKAFHKASLKEEYYEYFDVNSKNYMEKSRGTQVWISDCNRLLNALVAERKKHDAHEIVFAFNLIFELLEHIDHGEDIVFFADEGGSWQVGIHWDEVPSRIWRVPGGIRQTGYLRRQHRRARRESRGAFKRQTLCAPVENRFEGTQESAERLS